MLETVKNFFFVGIEIKNIKNPIVIIVPDPFVNQGYSTLFKIPV